MAFSLACDTGKTTLRIEGIDSDVTWNDVANAGAGSVAVDGGGTEDPSFFVTEHIANAAYQILKSIQFGDGTNALTFYSKNETVHFDDNQTFILQDNVTLQLGEKVDDWGKNGSYWRFNLGSAGTFWVIPNGKSNVSLLVYGSVLFSTGRKAFGMYTSIREFLNSILATSHSMFQFFFMLSDDSVTMKRCYVSGGYALRFWGTPVAVEDIHIHDTTMGLQFGGASGSYKNVKFTSGFGQVYQLGGAGVIGNIINPIGNISTVSIDDDTSTIKEQYTCDIHVVDKDSVNLEGVTITCEDKDSNQVFSVQTDANGVIAQQTITYKQWYGNYEVETGYTPHKFTFSKNGYTLLVMENVTVDARINWDVEVKFPERIRARMANPGRLAILR